MKKITGFSLILFLVMWLMTLDVVADNTGGDVNNDGEVNIADVNTVIDFILGSRSRQSIDVNGDGEINIADVNAVIGIILEGTSVSEEHEYVDLGLPSGTLWATCNIGASTPEDYGDHFAWGETAPKDYYDWFTYKWYNGSYGTLTKYNTDSYYGTVDNKTKLDSEDDAAYVNWGPQWRMPTVEQQKELIEKLRDKYDYVIIDSAPYLLVSDSMLINSYVDATLYILRADFTDKRLFAEINEAINSKHKPIKNVYLVLNGLDQVSAKFRYGYGKGYGMSYYSGYNYGYGENTI